MVFWGGQDGGRVARSAGNYVNVIHGRAAPTTERHNPKHIVNEINTTSYLNNQIYLW